MTSSKLIVIWDSEDILSSSIELFLSTKPDWQVVSTSNKAILNSLIMGVGTTNPDIVIIHQGFHNNPAIFPLQLLQDHPAIKVILISLEDNLMDIYSKQKILVRKATDLISVIENDSALLREND